MKTNNYFILIILIIFLFSCGQQSGDSENTPTPETTDSTDKAGDATADFSTEGGGDSSVDGSGGGSGQPGGQPGNGQAGLITAGEWNDLENLEFWQKINQHNDYFGNQKTWSFNATTPIKVVLRTEGGGLLNGIKLQLKKQDQIIWTTTTDKFGSAVLWTNLYALDAGKTTKEMLGDYQILIEENQQVFEGKNLTVESPNELTANLISSVQNKIELAFVVDATGSMSDELEFLKVELLDVIQKAKNQLGNSEITTSSVFYRDVGDEYITRDFPFSSNINELLNFIKNQSADGGGDFPEAVHSALDKSINEHQWSSNAKSKLLFLLLDAPAHQNEEVFKNLQKSITRASELGIKIIPISASGIDKPTEFLLRYFAVATNGTYVFITNDSGIGNDHLEPSVGKYEVEKLNELMVRLITKYSK